LQMMQLVSLVAGTKLVRWAQGIKSGP
jgi:hypothetical protein